jgi:hypothetical protein
LEPQDAVADAASGALVAQARDPLGELFGLANFDNM